MKSLFNLFEPEGLVNAFVTDPPEGFKPVSLGVNGKQVHGFLAELDLLTTMDEAVKRSFRKYRKFLPPFVDKLLKPMVLFVGTTVSEYALFPPGIAPETLRKAALAELKKSGKQFLIIKDLPSASPVLSGKENEFSEQLLSYLRDSGFFILYGQALAYVPVDFSSTEEYLQRLSRSRRKDIKRKLRSLSELTIEQVRTGDNFLDDPAIDYLYGLYLNVYGKSEIHFDKLTKSFFRKVFKDGESGGMVFLYRHQEKIIGFNLCFIVNDYLVDKYVGFLYPDSRDFNVYFVSWHYNLDFCIRNNLKAFIAGWTDPGIKAYLGADFTYTYHAVYIKNPLLRFILSRFKSLFESDRHTLEGIGKKEPLHP
ncbi:MAG: GNAT family N-acetyltransferase [Nitrospirae bacterium]|nr:GNAT family N-acetyltransferase [Nitrospirota bacterium]MCL5238518.1 GNAT family N-acetyltransferase [Nitrospirota bacterium]